MHGLALHTVFMEFFSLVLEELSCLCVLVYSYVAVSPSHGKAEHHVGHSPQAATASDESYHVPLRRYT